MEGKPEFDEIWEDIKVLMDGMMVMVKDLARSKGFDPDEWLEVNKSINPEAFMGNQCEIGQQSPLKPETPEVASNLFDEMPSAPTLELNEVNLLLDELLNRVPVKNSDNVFGVHGFPGDSYRSHLRSIDKETDLYSELAEEDLVQLKILQPCQTAIPQVDEGEKFFSSKIGAGGLEIGHHMFDEMPRNSYVVQNKGTVVHGELIVRHVGLPRDLSYGSEVTELNSFNISSNSKLEELSMFIDIKNPELDVDFGVNGMLMFLFDPGGCLLAQMGCVLFGFNGEQGARWFTTTVVDTFVGFDEYYNDASVSPSSKVVPIFELDVSIQDGVIVKAYDMPIHARMLPNRETQRDLAEWKRKEFLILMIVGTMMILKISSDLRGKGAPTPKFLNDQDYGWISLFVYFKVFNTSKERGSHLGDYIRVGCVVHNESYQDYFLWVINTLIKTISAIKPLNRGKKMLFFIAAILTKMGGAYSRVVVAGLKPIELLLKTGELDGYLLGENFTQPPRLLSKWIVRHIASLTVSLSKGCFSVAQLTRTITRRWVSIIETRVDYLGLMVAIFVVKNKDQRVVRYAYTNGKILDNLLAPPCLYIHSRGVEYDEWVALVDCVWYVLHNSAMTSCIEIELAWHVVSLMDSQKNGILTVLTLIKCAVVVHQENGEPYDILVKQIGLIVNFQAISMLEIKTHFSEVLVKRIHIFFPSSPNHLAFTNLLQMHFIKTCPLCLKFVHLTANQLIMLVHLQELGWEVNKNPNTKFVFRDSIVIPLIDLHTFLFDICKVEAAAVNFEWELHRLSSWSLAIENVLSFVERINTSNEIIPHKEMPKAFNLFCFWTYQQGCRNFFIPGYRAMSFYIREGNAFEGEEVIEDIYNAMLCEMLNRFVSSGKRCMIIYLLLLHALILSYRLGHATLIIQCAVGMANHSSIVVAENFVWDPGLICSDFSILEDKDVLKGRDLSGSKGFEGILHFVLFIKLFSVFYNYDITNFLMMS